MSAMRLRRYNLTGWAIKLNEITPGLDQRLAPTDCRLRPDQHATEKGDYDEVCFDSQTTRIRQEMARKLP